MKLKYAEFDPPIYKRGYDLRDCLTEAKGSNYKGLILYAEQLEVAATLCKELAAEVKGMANVEIDADTHRITVGNPEPWIDKLVKMGLLEEDIEEDEVSCQRQP